MNQVLQVLILIIAVFFAHRCFAHVSDRQNRRRSLVQVCWSLNAPDTLKREVPTLLKAGKELGIKRLLLVTWDEEKELDGGVQVVPIWKLLSGHVPVLAEN